MQVSFLRLGHEPILQSVAQIKGKTAAQIIKDLKMTDITLGIKTPYYIQPIDNQCIPTDEYPQLLSQPPATQDGEVDYGLQIMSSAESSECYILIYPENELIPPFYVDFTLSEMEDKTGEDIFRIVDEIIDIPHHSTTIKINKTDIDLKKKAIDLIEQMKLYPTTLECTFNDDKFLSKRAAVVEEIIKTEQSFIMGLMVVNGYFQEELRSSKIISEKEIQFIFQEIELIVDFQAAFLQNLQKHQNGYSSCIGNCFIKYIPSTEPIIRFQSSFPKISNIIQPLIPTDEMMYITQHNPEKSNLDLNSYLITVVQRPPRYILLLRELIKVTPQSHPDYRCLQLALSAVEAFIQKLDSVGDKSAAKERIREISERLSTHVSLLDTANQFITSAVVQLDQTARGRLYLFDSLVLLAGLTSDTKETVLMSAPLTGFRYESVTQRSIAIQSKVDNWWTCEFADAEVKSMFLSKFIKKREEEFAPFVDTTPIWREVLTTPAFVSRHDCAQLYENTFFIGGKSDKARCPLCTYNGSLFTVSQTYERSEIGAALVPCELSIYMCGGIVDGVPQSSIYCFFLGADGWFKVGHSQPKRGFAYHSAVCYDKRIYIFGGTDLTRPLGSFLEFDIASMKWANIDFVGGPEPRYLHSAVMYNDRMIIHGGTNGEQMFSDLWVYDFHEKNWQKMRTSGYTLPVRCAHKSVVVGKYMVIVGGENEAMDVPLCIVDLEKWKVRALWPIGNTIDGLTYTAAATLCNGQIITFGGEESGTGRLLNQVSILTLPKKYQPSQ